MNMICTWVRGNDGALLMEWTRTGDAEVHWEADVFDAAVEKLVQDASARARAGV